MSTSRKRIRRPHGSGALRTARVTVVLLTLVAMIATAAATPALAYWTSTGSSSGSASTGTLSPPTAVSVPTAAAPNVTVNWAAGAGGVVPQGYFVTKNDGTTSATACVSSPTVLVTGTTCNDTAVPDGTFTYVVTAVYESWTAPSVASGLVIVENATQLAFIDGPTDTLATAMMSPPVTVAVLTTDGGAFTSAGRTITLAIGANPGSGTLSGTVSATTDANGVATFADISINRAGVGYTLMVSSAGLTGATSATFTVIAPPPLGAAQTFSILAATAVTNTGESTVSGDVGVSPGLVVTGFTAGAVGGDIHINDAAAVAGEAAVLTAYNNFAGLPSEELPVAEIGGLTFYPGVYHTGGALALTGTVTLDAEGDPNAQFVFQTDAALNTAAGSNVILINGAEPSNVYWVAAGAAGTGAGARHLGTILSMAAITLGAGTLLIGRALSRDAVTIGASVIRFTTALPPTMTITGGATAVTKDTTPTISGTSNAPASSPVTVRVAGQTLTTVVGSDGTWSMTTTALTAGSHDIAARVRDLAGNGTNASQILTVEVNPAPVFLGTASTYVVLASTGITSTDTTVVNGDLGLYPSTSVAEAPAIQVNGEVHIADTAAATAQADLFTAYTEVSGRTPHTEIVGNLGGRSFHIGVHHSAAALALTGTVTLDAEGDPNAIFIFQSGAAFNTAASAKVVLTGGAVAANVYWVVNGAAGTGASTTMVGTILAAGAITLGAGTTLAGRALSLDGVTMAGNTIDGPGLVPAGMQGFVLESPAESDLSMGLDEVAPPPVSDAEAAPTQEAMTSPPQTSSVPVTPTQSTPPATSPGPLPETTSSLPGTTPAAAETTPPSTTTTPSTTTSGSAPAAAMTS